MSRLFHNRLWSVLATLAGLLTVAGVARPDALSAVQVLREGGCGGLVAAARPLRHDVLLDQAAAQWADGGSLQAAAESHGFRAEFTTGLHLAGPDSSMLQTLRQSQCRTVTDRTLRGIGMYRRGPDTWLVLAYADVAPLRSKAALVVAAPPAAPAKQQAASTTAPQAPLLAARALQLVNDVRARGTRCGSRSFAPAPPVMLSGALAGVAYGHAADMARHNYFEHQDLTGRSPADRVRAVGYQEKLVGENIAYGPDSVDEAVRGWLDSPDHCENIMDPRFAEMGIAYSAGQISRHGLYWVQVLAEPKT
jgi:uncharacterized protein YkwD